MKLYLMRHGRTNGGESLLDHQARVLGFLDWLAGRPEAALLVVAHEETLRVFHAHFEGLSAEAMRGFHFGNCAVLEYER